MIDCRASELPFGSPNTFFTRQPYEAKGPFRSHQIRVWSRRGISLAKEEISSLNERHCDDRLLSVIRHRICENVGH